MDVLEGPPLSPRCARQRTNMHRSRFLLVPAIIFLIDGVMIASPTRQSIRSQVPDELVKLLFQEICPSRCSDEDMALWMAHLKSKMHDLNGDAVPEWSLSIEHSDWCGVRSNCDYWIFQKRKNAYALILNGKELQVEKAVTNGYRDVASVQSSGFCSRDRQRVFVTRYKFDGTRYVEQPTTEDCVSAS